MIKPTETLEKFDLALEPEQIHLLTEHLSADNQFLLLLELLTKLNGFKFSENIDGIIQSFLEKNTLDFKSLEKLSEIWIMQKEALQKSANFQYFMQSFENWNYGQLRKYFGLQKIENHSLLNNWLDVSQEVLSDDESKQLESLRNDLKNYVPRWNEDELKIFFISGILRLLNYEKVDVYSAFAQRNLGASLTTLDGELVYVNGRVDFLVSAGDYSPEAPYFCLHEYKKERGTDSDPLGQLLVAMLVAQTHNEEKFPLYGAYVFGRYWYFVILDDDKYVISRSYDASEEPIYEVYKILRKLKGIIEKRQ